MDELLWAQNTTAPNVYEQKIPTVGFIDDVFRHAYWPAKEFFYELLAVPLEHVSEAPCWPSVRRMMWAEGRLTPPNVVPDNRQDGLQWLSRFDRLDEESRSILVQYIDANSTYICYEGSPGLLAFLDSLNITYIDVRISPVRFLPDVVLAMRSNSQRINALLHRICLPKREIEREAVSLMASFRHRERYEKPPSLAQDKGPILFVGQTPTDASIIVDGKFFALKDAAGTLAPVFRNRDIVYLRHPTTTDQHVRSEMETLASMAPQSLTVSGVNSYDLLCSDTDYEFLAISSGLIQEAAFFGKSAKSILPHICPLSFSDQPQTDKGYYQFSFETFTSDALWSAILGKVQGPVPARDSVRNLRLNELRELHNVWWAYPGHRVRPTDLTRVQTADIQGQLTQLTRRSNFLLGLAALDLSPHDADLAQFVSSRWAWPSGGVVNFEVNGNIFKDGRKAGQWRRVAGRPNSLLAIWDEGGWLDLIDYDGGNMLACRNDLGHVFKAMRHS